MCAGLDGLKSGVAGADPEQEEDHIYEEPPEVSTGLFI